MRLTSSYYDPGGTVPKDPAGNLRWRMGLYRRAARDRGLQRQFLAICRQDVLWWMNAFCFLYEPRRKAVSRVIPMVTWPHQDGFVRKIERCIDDSLDGNKVDVACEKSRGEGATWCVLMILLRRWLFEPLFAAGLVSRNEDSVDSQRNPDTLMYKLDWQLTMLPQWMLPAGYDKRLHRNYSEHTMVNPVLGGNFAGFAATGDVDAGGRKTVFFLDELGRFRRGEDWKALSNTQHITDCRLMVGSYSGAEGAHFQLMKTDTGILKHRLPWWENPTRNEMLYEHTDQGTVPIAPTRLLDLRKYESENREMLERLRVRGFMRPGRKRSRWYDRECDRGTNPYHIAEELDMDPEGVKQKPFDPAMLRRLESQTAEEPNGRGELLFDEIYYTASRFQPSHIGSLALFCQIGPDARPPRSKYVIGCDIAAGTAGDYSSNSTAIVIDAISGCQVAEYASNAILPDKFAEYVTAMADWFWEALVSWEVMGPGGQTFTNRIWGDRLWGNLYWHRNVSGKQATGPGYHCNKRSLKYALLAELAAGMSSGDLIIRSRDFLRECNEFDVINGAVVHTGAVAVMPGMDKPGEAHGDRVTGGAVAWLACKSIMDQFSGQPKKTIEDVDPDEISPDCYAGRRAAAEHRKRHQHRWLQFE